MNVKRATMLLRPDDEANLAAVVNLLGGATDVEAMRRALVLTRQILEWTKVDQADVWLEKGDQRERVHVL